MTMGLVSFLDVVILRSPFVLAGINYQRFSLLQTERTGTHEWARRSNGLS
jgi:hypothetical protein